MSGNAGRLPRRSFPFQKPTGCPGRAIKPQTLEQGACVFARRPHWPKRGRTVAWVKNRDSGITEAGRWEKRHECRNCWEPLKEAYLITEASRAVPVRL